MNAERDNSDVTDAGNWREHDDIVHLLYEHEREAPYMRSEGDVDYAHWSDYITACDIRVCSVDAEEVGGRPVYVKDPITCVVCLDAETELG